MLQSFADSDTEILFRTEKSRRFSAIKRVSLRKLIQMNRARKLEDLSVPLGNRLEALKGSLLGFHSIRINQHVARQARRWSAQRAGSKGLLEAGALWAMKEQWRIVFRWTEQGPADVQIVDYH